MQLGGTEYAATLLGTFVISAAVTPLLRRYALRTRIVDAPDGDRKLQATPIPYLGGLAIVFATSLVTVGAVLAGGAALTNLPKLLGIIAPGIALAVVGLIDDIKGLGPAPRFVAQSLAGGVTALLMARAGTVGQLTNIWWLDAGIAVFWVIGVTNALNLLDNMDGLASGVAAIAAAAYFAIALLNGQYLVAALTLALCGAALGFWVWNRHPASIYMGDSGALFVGFTLAAIGIRIDLDAAPRTVALLVPVLVLAVPVLDTTVVVVSRLARSLSPFQGGRDHLSHRLQRLGLSVPAAVGALWALAAATGAVAVMLPQVSAFTSSALLAVSGAAFVALLVFFLRIPATDPEVAA